MVNRCLPRTIALFFASLLALYTAACSAEEVRFAKSEGGEYTVTADGYTAAINKDGYLSSWKIKAGPAQEPVETVGSPLVYMPGTR